jgi:hypothetical protein
MFRLLNAACQVCAYSLDLQGYSKELMFGTSWAVRTLPKSDNHLLKLISI